MAELPTGKRNGRRPASPPRRPEVEALRGFTMRVGGRELLVLSAAPPSGGAEGLSGAEREVMEALLRGDSNAAIAHRRRRSARTVANQVASVFRKLGVGSRAELAAQELLRAGLLDGAKGRGG